VIVRRCSSADYKNMREKNYKNLQGAASKMFRDTNANSSFSPVDLANSLLWIKIYNQNSFLCVFASIPTVLETLGSICSSK